MRKNPFQKIYCSPAKNQKFWAKGTNDKQFCSRNLLTRCVTWAKTRYCVLKHAQTRSNLIFHTNLSFSLQQFSIFRLQIKFSCIRAQIPCSILLKDPAVQSCTVRKQGGRFRSWKDRIFVFYYGLLYYYKTKAVRVLEFVVNYQHQKQYSNCLSESIPYRMNIQLVVYH